MGCVVAVGTEDDNILEIVSCSYFFMALKSVLELVAAVVLIFLKVRLRVQFKNSSTLRFVALVKVAFHVDKEFLERWLLLVRSQLLASQLVL